METTLLKRDIQRQYLRNGDIKLSEIKKSKWTRLEIDDFYREFNGDFYIDENGNLIYVSPNSSSFDVYQFILVDSTPENLVANVPKIISDKVTFSINADGQFLIAIT